MTDYTIEARASAGQYDLLARQVARELLQLPFLDKRLKEYEEYIVQTGLLYHLSGDLSPTDVDRLTHELLIDPVTQKASITLAPSSPSSTPPPSTLSTTTSITHPTSPQSDTPNAFHIVDIHFHPGVTDTLAESILVGASMLGISGLRHAETGHRYYLDGRLSEQQVRQITEALLYNPVIQRYTLQTSTSQISVGTRFIASTADLSARGSGGAIPTNITQTIPLSDMTDDQLLAVSKRGLLALNLDEMRAIQQHFRELGREPTDVELETLAQTWSEHCSHKTFKATIDYREVDDAGNLLEQETIAGLLKSYIMRATQRVARPWVVSAFSDNAGIVRFNETHDIAFKVETHNHPSAIEPFGGANTGVGGVIRDVLGVSAQPIACTDILCFGPPETPADELPTGVLTPHRIASGVVNGVRDYGNKMGIPTVNGAILYHPGYIYNPLVFCGCLGILPHGSHPRAAQPGDAIVVLGGRTGRDGIHGATFSSGEMSSEINAQAGSAVQIGAPITEKKVTDVILQARDRRLYSAITDCGAGGFSSAIGEMAAEIGAYIELEKAPLKYQGLAPWEIWLSEAQERMVLAVPPQHLDALRDICALEEVEASILGKFTDTHRLVVTYAGQTVADLDMSFLLDGRPPRRMEAVWRQSQTLKPEHKQDIPEGPGQATNSLDLRDGEEGRPQANHPPAQHESEEGRPQGSPPPYPSSPARTKTTEESGAKPPRSLCTGGGGADEGRRPLRSPSSLDGEEEGIGARRSPLSQDVQREDEAAILLALLHHPSIASKEAVVRRYDHEVQGATVLKPMVGRAGNGPGDAAVLRPILDESGQATNAGIVLSNGINPLYGAIDPYAMALNAVDEALRNLAAVGGDIERAALLDNFCWGNPADPEQLGMLVRAVKGCYDAALGFGTPFISGKDSLNNEYRASGERLPVIPTLLISAVGVLEHAAQTIDMSLKSPGNLLYLVGLTRDELGGSHYMQYFSEGRPHASRVPAQHESEEGRPHASRVPAQHESEEGRPQGSPPLHPSSPARTKTTEASEAKVPHVDIPTARACMRAVGSAIRAGLVQACHDISEGGLAVAAAEMSLAGLLGLSIDLTTVPAELPDLESSEKDIALLFSESASRFLLEVAPEQREAFEVYMGKHAVTTMACIGRVTDKGQFVVWHGAETVIDLTVDDLQSAWKGEQI
ncbi:MAG TPA: phosphoribosylformylglycinamidine synthase subunit PurS [Ktedonobacteraceae bacterium]|nr:phosphoribosylformylglycinamidine synthase subunit PurS [Ktedonobacteraceae bacterium]